MNISASISGEGRHGHDVRIATSNIAGAISSVTGTIDGGDTLSGTDNTQSGDGQNIGLAQGPGSNAAEHSHTTSGQVTLDNRTHDHDIDDVTPPWRAVTFIMKL